MWRRRTAPVLRIHPDLTYHIYPSYASLTRSSAPWCIFAQQCENWSGCRLCDIASVESARMLWDCQYQTLLIQLDINTKLDRTTLCPALLTLGVMNMYHKFWIIFLTVLKWPILLIHHRDAVLSDNHVWYFIGGYFAAVARSLVARDPSSVPN